MKTAFAFQMTTLLPTSLAFVWKQVSTLQGVNDELMPLLRMTAPQSMEQMTFTQATLRQPLFASWLLLFGVIPFDRHLLQLDEVWEGGFRENSQSLVHRVWRHERILIPSETGCTLTDSLYFEPRLQFVGYLLLPIIRYVFEHRHRQLQQKFGVKT